MARRRNNNRRRPRQGQNNNNPAPALHLGARDFTQTVSAANAVAVNATGVLSHPTVNINLTNFPGLNRELTGCKEWKALRVTARLIPAGGADAVGLWAICVVPIGFGVTVPGVQGYSALGGRIGPVSRELRTVPYNDAVNWHPATGNAAQVWLSHLGAPNSTSLGILEVTISGRVRG